MISRGEVALIVAQKGAQAGLVSEKMFPAIVLMVIVTTLVTPLLLKVGMKKQTPRQHRASARVPRQLAENGLYLIKNPAHRAGFLLFNNKLEIMLAAKLGGKCFICVHGLERRQGIKLRPVGNAPCTGQAQDREPRKTVQAA